MFDAVVVHAEDKQRCCRSMYCLIPEIAAQASFLDARRWERVIPHGDAVANFAGLAMMAGMATNVAEE